MQRCSTCNAPLADAAPSCPYCGALTPAGSAEHVAKIQAEYAEKARAKQSAHEQAKAQASAADRRLESLSTHALVWSLVGPLVCCLPLGSGAAVVLGRKARALAASSGKPAPGRATAGVVLGAVGLALCLLTWGGVGWLLKAEAARKAELRALLSREPQEALSLERACALVELELLETGYGEYSVLDDFSCDGTVELRGAKAVLLDARVSKGRERKAVFGCLERQGRWKVAQLRADAECGR